MAGLSVTPLTTCVGASIGGVNLRERLDDGTAGAIRQTLAE